MRAAGEAGEVVDPALAPRRGIEAERGPVGAASTMSSEPTTTVRTWDIAGSSCCRTPRWFDANVSDPHESAARRKSE